jgi:hypothetical protein
VQSIDDSSTSEMSLLNIGDTEVIDDISLALSRLSTPSGAQAL